MEDKKNRGYIVATPVKDEEKNLPGLIKAVTNQTITPKLWVIVNDGSTDKSSEIIEAASKKYKWILKLNLPVEKRDIGLKYAFVCKKGFDYAIEYSVANNINYDFIGLLDADIIIENNYIEKLILHFNSDNKLGIASGGTWNFNGKEYIRVPEKSDLPSGAARLWHRKCFEETNGYLITYAPDTVSKIKANMKGWTTKNFADIKVKQTRMTSSAEGLWKGFRKVGEADYFIYAHPLYVLMRMSKFLVKAKYFYGLAYLFGYLTSLINKKERISDKEIIDYHKNKQLKDVIRSSIK